MTEVVDAGLSAAIARTPDPQLRMLCLRFFRFVAREDVAAYSTQALIAQVEQMLAFAQVRAVETPLVDVRDERDAPFTVAMVVTDDMPFLVDSVSGGLSLEGRSVRLIIHPQLVVRRDATGQLLQILDLDVDEDRPADAIAESWMRVDMDRDYLHPDGRSTASRLTQILHDVRAANADWLPMRAKAEEIAASLEANPPIALPIEEVKEGAELLRWLTEDNLTFLGYREYALASVDGQEVLVPVAGTGLGILRQEPNTSPESAGAAVLPRAARKKARENRLLVLTKANSRSTVHRNVFLDYFGVKVFDQVGQVTGEKRFLGLLTAAALTESIVDVPVLRVRYQRVMDDLQLVAGSHRAKDLLQFLETYPRDEFFQTHAGELVELSASVMQLQERRQTRLFVRVDDYQRFVSCLVYLPRDRYTTAVRLRIERLLVDAFNGASVDYTARVSESVLARLHCVVRLAPGADPGQIDIAALELQLAAAARSWEDDFTSEIIDAVGETKATPLLQQFGEAFPEAYKEQFSGAAAVSDVLILADLPPGELSLRLYRPSVSDDGTMRFTVIRVGSAMSLSRILPTLQMMGVEVIDEHPYEIKPVRQMSAWILDFGLLLPVDDVQNRENLADRFADAFRAAWQGGCETDAFNGLVVRAGLRWDQVVIIRAYARYLRQIGSAFGQDYIQQTMLSNVQISSLLVQLFEVQFVPGEMQVAEREAKAGVIVGQIEAALNEVRSLDQDRIFRSFLSLIRATLRTNAYLKNKKLRRAFAIKLDPKLIPDLPLPKPMFEIWVYSPRVEGVHLRFGRVARGGLRWSDRREDFRTEVLGLAKAQEVKNAVIVPVGAKGGFYPVHLPDPAVDREGWLTEGKAAYREFISALLDITDNLVGGAVVPPADVVRRDCDDTYLVVAADKGTATFSDLANEIATEYGFWLGDAFASGGSQGYDHKAMGITARGTWESVKRHFRELGLNTQTEDFTVVGVGDMGGDVFGNGMLLSDRIKLVAAFDHRDIFIDPSPTTAKSFAERERLFALPRSSWADYNSELISAGGGVYSRAEKLIHLSPEACAALGIECEEGGAGGGISLTPNEVVRAILAAPVDLLWNGGIGTYVKAQTETNSDVDDKANDPVRLNGNDLRCLVVGEGGNLGLTQLGRVEAARSGIRLNTDAIDNSAGVDTSDHEVNIKILLDEFVRAGELSVDERNGLLTEMTDDVALHVLADNYGQNVTLGNARAGAAALISVHLRMVQDLERRGLLNRALGFLPDDQEFQTRQHAGEGLTSPELAVLMAYAKISLTAELTDAGLGDDPWFEIAVRRYFPALLAEKFGRQLTTHPLKDQIISTVTCNQIINLGGITMVFRAMEETGATAIDVVRAASAAIEIFSIQSMTDAIDAQDNFIPAAAQTQLHLEMRRLLDRATRWFLQTRGSSIDVAEQIARFAPIVRDYASKVPESLRGSEADRWSALSKRFMAAGAPADLADTAAGVIDTFSLLDIREIAGRAGEDVASVLPLYFTISERYDVDQLLLRITALPRKDRWSALARQALRSDLYGVISALTARVIRSTNPVMDPLARIEAWEGAHQAGLGRARSTLEEISGQEDTDLATLSVALRVLRNLVAQGGTSNADRSTDS
ncbi:MAG: NAD-glutamate dehydrogenase, partial [Candidatus Nanopelagicales bacterium]|nr:NAD-glutamate dehydrogenase [Candidatus Nanopelagicales bacterium]